MSQRNNPRAGIRHPQSFPPVYQMPRPPTTDDKFDRWTGKRYEVPSFWIIAKNSVNGIPVASGTEGAFYYLSEYDSSGDAIWLPLSTGGGSAPLLKIETDDGSPFVEADGSGVTQILGGAGVNVTGTGPGNTVTVSLTGGGVGIDQVGVQFATGLGTDPVEADGTGLISVDGSVVANGTNASTPVASHSRAVNTYDIEVQVAGSVSSAPGNTDAVGLVQLDSNFFNVDSDGWVTPAGGASAGFVWREETGTSATLVANEGVFANNAGTVTLTLPASCSIGDAFAVYQEGAGVVRVAQNASDQIRFGSSVSTSGVTGYIESLAQGDSVVIICVGTNRFRVINSVGSWTIS